MTQHIRKDVARIGVAEFANKAEHGTTYLTRVFPSTHRKRKPVSTVEMSYLEYWVIDQMIIDDLGPGPPRDRTRRRVLADGGYAYQVDDRVLELGHGFREILASSDRTCRCGCERGLLNLAIWDEGRIIRLSFSHQN